MLAAYRRDSKMTEGLVRRADPAYQRKQAHLQWAVVRLLQLAAMHLIHGSTGLR